MYATYVCYVRSLKYILYIFLNICIFITVYYLCKINGNLITNNFFTCSLLSQIALTFLVSSPHSIVIFVQTESTGPQSTILYFTESLALEESFSEQEFLEESSAFDLVWKR